MLFGDLTAVVENYQQAGEIAQLPVADILHEIIGTFASYAAPVILGLQEQVDAETAAKKVSYFLEKALAK